jgi:hypothetical protein
MPPTKHDSTARRAPEPLGVGVLQASSVQPYLASVGLGGAPTSRPAAADLLQPALQPTLAQLHAQAQASGETFSSYNHLLPAAPGQADNLLWISDPVARSTMHARRRHLAGADVLVQHLQLTQPEAFGLPTSTLRKIVKGEYVTLADDFAPGAAEGLAVAAGADGSVLFKPQITGKGSFSDFASWLRTFSRYVAVAASPCVYPMLREVYAAWTNHITDLVASQRYPWSRIQAYEIAARQAVANCTRTTRA